MGFNAYSNQESAASASGYISAILGEYKVDANTITAGAATGYLRYNNATQTSATNIYINEQSQTGVDITLFLELLAVGAAFVIQDKNDHANIQQFEITSAPVDNGTYWTIPVTFVSSAGTGTTGFANNHEVFAAAFNPETDEKVKISANDTTEGYLNGKLVAGTGITLTENNDGANETLSVIVNYTDLNSVYARLDATNQPFTGVIQSISPSFAGLVASYTGGKAGAIVAGTARASFIYDNTGSFSIQARTNAQVLAGSPSGFDTKLEVDSSGNVGIGTVIDTLTAKFHLRSITELLRLEYDASNYLSGTVSSAGRMTLTATGSDNGITFNPTLRLNNLTADRLVYSDTNKDLKSVTIGTGLSLSTGTLSNTAPDQTVSFTGGTNVTIGGTYPSFTITDNSISSSALSGYAKLDSTNQPFTSSGINSLNTSSRQAYDSSGNLVLDWENLFFQNAGGIRIFDFSSGVFKDFLDVVSFDIFSRTLKNSLGNVSFDYENLAFPTLTTNGIVTTNSGDGSLAIKPNLGGFNCTVNVSTGFIQTGNALRFRAPYDFQASEWFISSMTGGDVQLDILRSSVTWPVFTSDSICNTAYPELISNSNEGTGSAATWDPIDKDDYIVILIYTVSNLEDFTLQVIGDKL